MATYLHSTTRSPWTWVRLLLLAFLSYGISRVIPYAGAGALDNIVPFALNIGILFSITGGFLMFKTLTRRTALDEHIAVELNKIRRIYHLSLHLKKQQPALTDWFTRVRTAIITYLRSFENHTFVGYEKGNPLFRAVTYAVYGLPTLNEPYNTELYTSLLQTTSNVTEARENIRSRKGDYIGRFSWLVIIVISLVFAGLIITSTPDDALLRNLGAAVMFCLFLVLQLIYEYDSDNAVRARALAEKYANDLKALENAQTEY
jgi:hypothetical protein